jgi:hypothetical protein
MKLSYVRAFFHDHISWPHFDGPIVKKCILKPREVIMHQKKGCAGFFNICPKREVLGIFFMFGLLPFFSPSSPLLSS